LLVKVMMCSRLSAPPTDESLRPTNVRLAVGIGTGVGVGDAVGFGVGVGFAVGFGVRVGVGVGDGLALGPFEGVREGDADAAAIREGDGDAFDPPKPPRVPISNTVAPTTTTRSVPMTPITRRNVSSVTGDILADGAAGQRLPEASRHAAGGTTVTHPDAG
jgi:hypothetical protein